MVLSLIDILGSHAAVAILLMYMPHSAHPTCKIQTFLRMRAASSQLCFITNTCFLVDRLNMLASHHRLQAVREWAIKVKESGWLHQLWPCMKLSSQWNATSWFPLRKDRNSVRPQGMRQSYFIKKQDEYRRGECFLGWTYGRRSVDGSLFCNLSL